MKIKTLIEQEITPEALAESLAKSSTEDFCKFWFEFEKHCEEITLDNFAKDMARNLGANRKIVLKRLADLIRFWEIYEERKDK